MNEDTDLDKILAFVAGIVGYEQAKRLVEQLNTWDAEQFNRFGRLLGYSRGLNKAS